MICYTSEIAKVLTLCNKGSLNSKAFQWQHQILLSIFVKVKNPRAEPEILILTGILEKNFIDFTKLSTSFEIKLPLRAGRIVTHLM